MERQKTTSMTVGGRLLRPNTLSHPKNYRGKLLTQRFLGSFRYQKSQKTRKLVTILLRISEVGNSHLFKDNNFIAKAMFCFLVLLLQMAITAFNNFASVEPDLIWLSLNDLYCPEELTPPHEALRPVKLAGTGAQSKEYAENVTALLSAI